MFELVQALNEGAEALKNRTSNTISVNAGCELFIGFVTLFPHENDVSVIILGLVDRTSPIHQSFKGLKIELVKQGQKYAHEALSYRQKIAQLVLGFIKDDSVVSNHPIAHVH